MSKKEKSNSDLDRYYQTCAYPKPKPTKKKRLLYNGYKDKPQRRCYYTGRPYAERHELWGGPFRQISIREGFQVDLCPELHREFHAHTEWAKREELKWQQHYQREYERKLIESGIKPQHARKLWMDLIGRNYLEEL